MKTLSCWDISELKPELNTGCCSSCHNDYEDGYGDLCTSTLGDIEFWTCCNMANRLTDEIKEEIVKLVPEE